MRLQGLILDLDGTLLDSAPDLRQALNKTLGSDNRRDLTLHEVKSMVGDGMGPLIHRAYAATGAPISNAETSGKFQSFIVNYQNLPPDPAQIYPGAVEALKKYQAAGIKLGLCTNKQEAATLQLLKELAMLDYFDFVAGGDTFPAHKPHPDHVLGVIRELKVPSTACVMIGDSINDVLAAHSAGIPCIVTMHGYGADYANLGGDKMISGFKELPQALEALGFQIVL